MITHGYIGNSAHSVTLLRDYTKKRRHGLRVNFGHPNADVTVVVPGVSWRRAKKKLKRAYREVTDPSRLTSTMMIQPLVPVKYIHLNTVVGPTGETFPHCK